MNPSQGPFSDGKMPPKKVTIAPPGQGSIQAFFHKPTATTPAQVTATTSTPLLEIQAPVQSTDPKIVAFMASLTPSERIAHKIAVEKLGTSYDIARTHGFVRWSQTHRT
jgi:hypothetical protein